MRIAGPIFLVIGAIVAVASWILLKQGQKMSLFMYAGIAMAVFGLARTFIDSSLPKRQHTHHAHLERDLQQQFSERRSLAQIPRVCGMCGTRNHPRANFCGNCGNRL